MHAVYDFHKILTSFDKFTNNSRKPFHSTNLPVKPKNIYKFGSFINFSLLKNKGACHILSNPPIDSFHQKSYYEFVQIILWVWLDYNEWLSEATPTKSMNSTKYRVTLINAIERGNTIPIVINN